MLPRNRSFFSWLTQVNVNYDVNEMYKAIILWIVSMILYLWIGNAVVYSLLGVINDTGVMLYNPNFMGGFLFTTFASILGSLLITLVLFILQMLSATFLYYLQKFLGSNAHLNDFYQCFFSGMLKQGLATLLWLIICMITWTIFALLHMGITSYMLINMFWLLGNAVIYLVYLYKILDAVSCMGLFRKLFCVVIWFIVSVVVLNCITSMYINQMLSM